MDSEKANSEKDQLLQNDLNNEVPVFDSSGQDDSTPNPDGSSERAASQEHFNKDSVLVPSKSSAKKSKGIMY